MLRAFSFSVRNLLPFAGSILIHAVALSFFLFSNQTKNILMPLGRENILPEATITWVDVMDSQKAFIKSPLKKIQPIETPAGVDTVPAKNAETTSKAPSAQNTNSNTSMRPGVANGTQTDSALAHYLFGLRQMIDSKKVYPAMSRKMGETGKVLLSLQVLRNGELQEVKIKTRSQFARLDQAALMTVSTVNKYQPIPDTVAQDAISVDIPIEFSM